MNNLQLALAKVKGLGSAKDGTSHFWHQRLTALLLIPLMLWLGFSLAALPADYETMVRWIQHPLVSAFLVVSIAVIFHHARLGLQVIIEDYIASHWGRMLCIIMNNFICLIAGIIGVMSVLRIALGA